MPTTITSSSGAEYHVYQLPDLSTPEPEDIIQFTTLDNDLSDGYRSTNLFGSNNGVRRWTLKFPTLAHLEVLPNTVTDINGAPVSREQYIRSLYAENKVTGQPFAFPDPATGQYYLVDFEDEELSMQRMRVKLYSTGLKLKQRRIEGESVFEGGRVANIWEAYNALGFPTTLPGPIGDAWQGQSDTGISTALAINGTDVTAGTSNGKPIVRFSLTTNDGFLSGNETLTVKEIYLLMKMREATFSNNAGIVTDDDTVSILVGDTGTTKFFNHTFGTGFEYELNNTSYAENDMQAPMNAWGIVHWVFAGGIWMANLQIGKDRSFAGRFAEVDIAYMLFSENLLPAMVRREIYEALNIRRAALG